jgi:hypothetical protein
MSTPPKTPDAARKSAQTYFTHTEQRDRAIKQEIEKERAASAAKTARLRALRLAKEAAEKEAADKRKADSTKAGGSTPRRKPITP